MNEIQQGTRDTITSLAHWAEDLDTVLAEEVQAKTAKNVAMRTNLARFPFIKGHCAPQEVR